MKNSLIVILLVVSVALGGLVMQKSRQANQNVAKLETLQQQVTALEADLVARDTETSRLREKLEKSLAESAANAGAAAQLSLTLTNRIEEVVAEVRSNTKPANPLSEMFKSQEMRDMIKQQQKTVLASMVDKNYADLIKGLQLTPEQADYFKELMAKKMAVGADLGIEMMGGDLTPEQRQELMQRIKDSTQAVTDEIKQFLGTENYATYEAYEKTVPDRMAISGFRDQLAGTDFALTADQEASLVQAMSQERQNFKFTTDFSDQNDFSPDMFSKFTEERVNLFFEEQDRLNQLYLARAQTILSPDQFQSYQKSLKAQQDMMKMGMKMAASMFGTKK